VVPSGIEKAGGKVLQVGIPMEPGHLTVDGGGRRWPSGNLSSRVCPLAAAEWIQLGDATLAGLISL